MTLDPTLRDKLAKTIHDALCPCDYFPDGRSTIRDVYLAAADKAAELLTASPPYRFPDGWERGHEAKYWAQTGLTPYGLTLDPERAPGVLNWLGVNYYTPDSPHLPASAAAPIVLPTAEEVRNILIANDPQNDGIDHVDDLAEKDRAVYARTARKVLDLIASRVLHWVPVEPGTVIKAGTRLREDWDDQITEWTLGEDQDPYQNCGHQHRYYLDPRTVPAEPEPLVALVLQWAQDCGEAGELTRDEARDLLARIDAARGAL